MATKRKSKARRKKAARRAGLRITVLDLKKQGKSTARLKQVLARAARSKVGFVVLNAPFKLRAPEAVS